MADNNNGDSSASTILVSVVVILIILGAFYFGFMRGGSPADDVNVDVNLPTPGEVAE
jgi:hypothetical protein